ncbi:hypothetical protein Ddc_15938 [Ditylenchus destructor]|nr:hypothetical protein Ddc_15938 [Ditylenchus destructor]
MDHVNTIKSELAGLYVALNTFVTKYAVLPGLYPAVKSLRTGRNEDDIQKECVDQIVSLLGSTIMQCNKAIIPANDMENELKKVKKESDFNEDNKRELNGYALKLHAFLKEALDAIDAGENQYMGNSGIPGVLRRYRTQLRTPLIALKETAYKIKKVLCYMERPLPGGVFTYNVACRDFF